MTLLNRSFFLKISFFWQFLLSGMLLALAIVLLSALQQPSFAETRSSQGVRGRLYWIDDSVDPEQRLTPNQSPNLDVSIPSLKIAGDEAWFTNAGKTYQKQYFLLLETELKVQPGQRYEFQLTSTAPAALLLNGDELLFAEQGDPQRDDFVANRQQMSLRIMQWVNEQPRGLSLLWRDNENESFEAIPKEVLTSDDFYFRPNNGAAKRMSRDEDRPGKYQKVTGVFPGLDLFPVRPPEVEVPVGGLSMLSDGRLVVVTFDARRLRAPVPQEQPDGELWLYSNLSGDPSSIQRQRIAEQLYEPAGVCVVDESIYVSQRDEVTRFDFSADEDLWQPTTIATGWESNDFHALSFGLIHQPVEGGHPGYLLMARGSGLGLMKNPPNHGSVWRIDLSKPSGENVEAITGGHRTPNGIGFGPAGEIYVTDNQGEYTPANELNLIAEGSFYGFRQRTGGGGAATPFQDREMTPPAVFMPQDEIANSPSQPHLIPEGWPYAGQMIVGDVKYGGLNRISLQKVNGRWQGAAYRFTQGLEAGTNRICFASDGSLFVGGIGGDHSSTWTWVNRDGKNTYQGLQRLKPNDQPVFDLQQVEATKQGFRIHFTQPVPHDWLSDVGHYRLTQWRYQATPHYGGPKIDQRELYVTRAVAAENCRTVDLKVEGRELGHVTHLVADPKSTEGERIWSAEAWYTLWQIPN